MLMNRGERFRIKLSYKKTRSLLPVGHGIIRRGVEDLLQKIGFLEDIAMKENVNELELFEKFVRGYRGSTDE
ncbi:hypothetical protein P8452_64913 [Trifolium repens]|nr:hypothetical protein P8452_64913 [Trifolium repens]